MPTLIQAIPTTYAGVRFRSRTEARWALFFDLLHVSWAYELEGYQLPSGWYVPDFWLPEAKTWLEVKGPQPTRAERAFCGELAAHTGGEVVLFWGEMGSWGQDDDGGYWYLPNGGGDNYFAPCFCPHGTFGFEHGSRGHRICSGIHAPHPEYADDPKTGSDPRVDAAAAKARAHRFY